MDNGKNEKHTENESANEKNNEQKPSPLKIEKDELMTDDELETEKKIHEAQTERD